MNEPPGSPASSVSPRSTVLPFYLVCDVSASMAADGRMAALNAALVSIWDAVSANPVVADFVRLGIVGFSTASEVLLPLCDLSMVDDLPELRPGGLTSYAAAFRLLRATIEGDVAVLVGDERRVYRPMVFFFSDGEPTDALSDWKAARRRLTESDFPHRPDIVAFGIGHADPATIGQVASSRAFVADDPTAIAAAIAGIGDVVLRSVVSSGLASRPVLPQAGPDGFREYPVSDVL